MIERFDYIVIGGGSGGIASARRAAEYGASVALIEGGRLGGTCVNVGCVPKKVMWNASYINEMMALSSYYGFSFGSVSFDWNRLKVARDAYVSSLNDIYANNLAQSGVKVVPGWGQFVDSRTIQVDNRVLNAEHVLIATGGRPKKPEIGGAHLALTSDDFFDLEHLPRRALVVGAGYIATELAGVLNGLGADVTVLLRKQQLLRKFDVTLRETVMDEMQRQGVNFLTCVQLEALFREDNARIGIQRVDGETITGFDCVIWAVGRSPNLEQLEIENTGLSIDEHGFLSVDAYQNTHVNGVYAVGDVTHYPHLTPVAITAGRKLADRVFGNQTDACLDYESIPTVIFSHPPIGTVGLSEDQAGEKFGHDQLKIYHRRFTNMLYALVPDKPPTVMKLITMGADEKIVGCHIIGEACDEIIQGFAVAIKMGACKRDLDRTIAIHPTAAEELVTMR